MGKRKSDEDDLTETEDEEDEFEEQTKRRREKKIPRKKAAAATSNGDDEDEDATMEDADLPQTQMTQGDGSGASSSSHKHPAGSILRIRVTNFMCHKNLEVEFQKGLNAITGNNGSGKSALLVALSLCLGGATRASHRAGAIKDFVLRPADKAILVVELANSGPGAYNVQRYGSTIVVQREIKAAGPSTYKVGIKKDGKRTLAASKASEISQITGHFSIFVDNPCCILMQDTAKNLLSSRNGRDHYEYFFRGTQLASLEDEIQHLKQKVNELSLLVKNQESFLANFVETEYNPRKLEFEQAGKLRQLAADRQEALRHLPWAKVHAAEKVLERLQKIHEAESKKVAEADKERQIALQRTEEERQRQVQQSEGADDLTRQMEALATPHREAKQRVAMAKAELTAQQEAIKAAKSDIQRLKRLAENARKRLDDARNEASSRTNAVKIDRDRRLSAAQKSIVELEARTNAVTTNVNALTSDLEGYQGERDVAMKAEETAKRQAEMTRKHVEDAEMRLKDVRTKFGSRTGQYIDEINRRRREFAIPPIGPIGMLVRVKRPEWNKAVELACGPILFNTYLTDSKADRDAFYDMVVKMGVPIHERPVIIQLSRNFRKRIESVQVEGAMTVLDMIDIDHNERDWVLQAMCIQADIEKKLLVGTNAEAFSRRNLGYQVFDLDGRMRQSNADGSFASYGVRKNNKEQPSIFATEDSSRIPDLQQKLKQCQGVVSEAMKRHRETAAAVTSCQRDLDEEKRTLQRINGELQRMRREVRRIEQEQIDDEPEEFDPTGYEEDIRKYDEDVESAEHRLQVAEKDFIPKKAALTQRETELTEVEKEMKEVETRVNAMLSNAVQLRNAYDTILNAQKRLEAQLSNLQRKQKEAETKVVNEKMALDQLRADAIAVQPEELFSDKSPDQLSETIRQIAATLQQEEKRNGRSIGEIQRSFEAARTKLESLQTQKEHADALLTHLHDGSISRQKKLNASLEIYSTQISWQFNGFLTWRSGSGSLKFDHENKTVDISSAPNQGSKATNVVSMLSGGEQSFTGLCYGLAVAGCMPLPFRCLDEYDVFMDEGNRQLSLELIGAVIKHQKERQQFIILTPLTLPRSSGINMKRICLQPPDRGGEVVVTNE